MRKHISISLAVAFLIALGVVLPYEYDIDLLGSGALLGLRATPPSESIKEHDNIVVMIKTPQGLRLSDVPSRDSEEDPIPLPDPAVFSDQLTPPSIEQFNITLKANEQTEVKFIAKQGQVLLFEWQATHSDIYTDFHGHLPEKDNVWVRYKEDDGNNLGTGSLIIPFDGEHGWYWLNLSDSDVSITLKVTGYFERVIDYGISKML